MPKVRSEAPSIEWITGEEPRCDDAMAAAIALDAKTRARTAELAEAFRRRGDVAPHEVAISEFLLERQRAACPQGLCEALREAYRAEIDAEAEAAKKARNEERRAYARAWKAPPIPVEAIESLLETYRPTSMEGFLADLSVGCELARQLMEERGQEPADAARIRDPLWRDPRELEAPEDPTDRLRWSVGLAVAADVGETVVDTEAATAWCVAIGEEVERRIAEGWTPSIPQGDEELAPELERAIGEGRASFLARRLMRFGCSTDEERVARLVRAFRMRLDAERAALALVEEMLSAIDAGDLARVRALDEEMRKRPSFTTDLLSDVDYLRLAVDPEMVGSLDPEPLASLAERAVSWDHKGEAKSPRARELEVRLLTALAGADEAGPTKAR